MEVLLPTGVPRLVLLKCEFNLKKIFDRVTNFETGCAKDHFITSDQRLKTVYYTK